ncbi:MAG: 30S ribosomal protein S4 [Bacilli bacterium]
MAKYIDADCRLCRREGCKLFLKGERCLSGKCAMVRRPVAPGQHGASNMRKKSIGYGVQLREKQKIKRYYGLLEKQFHKLYENATKIRGNTGEIMLSLLERRLDNVVYRMGLSASRGQSRQLVNHGHITVNEIPVNIPSYIVKVGDVVAVKENKKDNAFFKEVQGMKITTPKWLEFDTKTLVGKVNALPQRDDVDMNFAAHLVVELYSK